MKPFNLELAKAGHPMYHGHKSGMKFTWVAGPDYNKAVCVRHEYGSLYLFDTHHLFMDPLCEIEGKPVYPGDTLYITEDNASHAKVKRGDTFKLTFYRDW